MGPYNDQLVLLFKLLCPTSYDQLSGFLPASGRCDKIMGPLVVG